MLNKQIPKLRAIQMEIAWPTQIQRTNNKQECYEKEVMKFGSFKVVVKQQMLDVNVFKSLLFAG